MSKKRNAQSTQMADVRGLRRAQHFANGGTPQTWRGASRTYDQDTPARRSKQACRGRVAE